MVVLQEMPFCGQICFVFWCLISIIKRKLLLTADITWFFNCVFLPKVSKSTENSILPKCELRPYCIHITISVHLFWPVSYRLLIFNWHGPNTNLHLLRDAKPSLNSAQALKKYAPNAHTGTQNAPLGEFFKRFCTWILIFAIPIFVPIYHPSVYRICTKNTQFCSNWVLFEVIYSKFLVSGRDLACQQEVSLALTKTPPIHYYNVVDSAFSNYAG